METPTPKGLLTEDTHTFSDEKLTRTFVGPLEATLIKHEDMSFDSQCELDVWTARLEDYALKLVKTIQTVPEDLWFDATEEERKKLDDAELNTSQKLARLSEIRQTLNQLEQCLLFY